MEKSEARKGPLEEREGDRNESDGTICESKKAKTIEGKNKTAAAATSDTIRGGI